LAAIRLRTGVAQMMECHVFGFVAWWIWRTIYLVKLPSFEKRLHVALNWTPALLFAKPAAQYISFHAMEKVNVACVPADSEHLGSGCVVLPGCN
jgi:NADH dehydrogenase